MNPLVIGVDIGGSHITAAIVDIEKHVLVHESRKRLHIDSKADVDVVVGAWSDVIRSVAGSQVNYYVGIAMPGPFDYEQGISLIKGLDKYENLYGVNVKERLSRQLGIPAAHIKMNNDAACFLGGEMFAGTGAESKHSIGVTLGTGTGSAVYRNGVSVDANLGPSPFMDSIADNYLSTRWFVKTYLEKTGLKVANVKELVAKYNAEPVVQDIFSTFSLNLASFLHGFIVKEDPQVVILGGNISQCSNLFLPEAERRLREFSIHVPIKVATLGEDATMLGAASLISIMLGERVKSVL